MGDESQEKLWKSDPKRYAKCAQPFATKEAATAAMEAFFDAISEARERLLIADVELVVKDSYEDGEDVGAFMSSAHFGCQLEREAMLAYALGQCQQERESLIGSLLKGKGGRPRKT